MSSSSIEKRRDGLSWEASDRQPPDVFFTLLTLHPELEQWLIEQSSIRPQLDEKDLHERFLEQCTLHGVTLEDYPFTADDRGEAALRDYWLGYTDTDSALRALVASSDISATSAEEHEHDLTPRQETLSGGEVTSPQDLVPQVSPSPSDPTSIPTEVLPKSGSQQAWQPQGPLHTVPQTASTPPGPLPLHVGLLGPAFLAERMLAVKGSLLSRSKRRLLSQALLILLLMSILTPAGIAIGYGLSAYRTYTALRDQAHSGVQHLLNVKTIFTGVKAHPTGFLDVNKLHLAQKEFVAAHKDFQQLRYMLDHSAIIDRVINYLPQFIPQITTARAGSQIGMDVADIGQELVSTALTLAPTFRGPLLTETQEPLVTSSMFDLVGTTIDTIMPRLSDISTQARMVSIDALPVNPQQRNQFFQLIAAIPQAQTDLIQVRQLLGAAGWMFGVDAPHTFLVQTMDRGELRPTGGFTGQYGELQINRGRIAPFTLKDISLVEYVDNSPTTGQLAPPQYRSWWPFANWGLRDSNLSADFPTSANIAIAQYKHEVGHQVDGVILFTPFLVEHILQIIGPIQVPGYNETITSQNLEDRLHYYQLDNAGIFKQVVVQPDIKSTSYRKRFTSLLAHLLMDRVRHAPPDEIITVGRQLLHDLKTKDLQVYVTNPQIEKLLMQYRDAAQMDRSTTHDGLYIVETDISANKASQYVRTAIHDTVTLDAAGGATHVMRLRFIYNQLGPVYGYDAYRDYVRVYVPPASKFLWGNGFDTGVPLCGGRYVDCAQYDVYHHGELLCPAGLSQPGAQPPAINDPDGGRWRPLDTIGPPTNRVSDEPGRAMLGGLVVVPKNCTMTVTLSWYVPPMGQGSYSLLVQHQAGTLPELDLTILPTPGDCAVLATAGQHFDSILDEDTFFPLKKIHPTHARASCYPQPGV